MKTPTPYLHWPPLSLSLVTGAFAVVWPYQQPGTKLQVDI